MVLSMVAASIITGVLMARIGYYTPFMICGVCLLSVGAGLLTTLGVETSQAKWIGYQFLYGWGLGCTFQAPNLAAQTVLPPIDVPIGTSLMFFSQLLGGAVFISVGQNIFNNQLFQRLSGLAEFNLTFIQNSGATSLTHLPDEIKPIVLAAYNESLRKVFQVGLILTCLTLFGALALEWRSTKKDVQKTTDSVENGKIGERRVLQARTK
jgi:MFS family permease